MTAREIVETQLGPLFVGASEAGLHRIDFVREGRDEPWLDAALEREAAAARGSVSRSAAGARPVGGDAAVREAVRQLAAYFAGVPIEFALKLAPHGTVFQRAVWCELRAIPSGQTRSYSQIAAAVGRPAAVRAVGQAVGRNPLSVVVPCHRVVGADGSLTGYAGGIDRKRWLLARDGVTGVPGRSRAPRNVAV